MLGKSLGKKYDTDIWVLVVAHVWHVRQNLTHVHDHIQQFYGNYWTLYTVNAGVHEGSILRPTFFLLYINNLPDDVLCNIAIFADDTTLYFKCDQASNLWQQLDLTSEFEFDLQETLWTGEGSGLLISMLEKLN